ncbi:riboflavin synthase [Prochlorococcus sp. MIT 1307]|uniref:riboflavin synthase n=1 Tax=Prochlorococcus sp. MIT 1307 TaxID=3096219 RepID=UPI002A761A95|nr:riboflavin synthase [Prochlorococcus sp. MIT 1307]
MFTGLIQSVGQVEKRGGGLVVKGCKPFSPLILGASVAVDGVCLTVADICMDGFFADVSEETLSRTTLGFKAKRGKFVNLEPALRLSDRLGGHLVSGHVDGLGEVLSLEDLRKSWRLEVRWQNPKFGKYICEKGSISIDGISLTVGGCSENGSVFWIAVIPHTWEMTSLKYLTIGSLVNLEADLMAKYAESLLDHRDGLSCPSQLNSSDEISEDWLIRNGWN